MGAENAELAKVGIGTVTYNGDLLGILTGDITVTIGKEVYKLRAGINGGIPLLTRKQWVVGLSLTLACTIKQITRDNIYWAVGIGQKRSAGGFDYLDFGMDLSLEAAELEFVHTDHNGNQSGWHFWLASPTEETALAYKEAEAADLPATFEANADTTQDDEKVYGYYFETQIAS